MNALDTIRILKVKKFTDVLIPCNLNYLPYHLIFLTADCSSNKELMELLGKWRKENEQAFITQFPMSVEGTTWWFKEKLIAVPDRLLFLIEVNGTYVGHVGLFRFDFKTMTCEIDNIVRGEPDYPGIMKSAIRHMMNWGTDTLGIKKYSLKVLSGNERAIRFYKKMGFVETGIEPTDVPDKYYVIMKQRGETK